MKIELPRNNYSAALKMIDTLFLFTRQQQEQMISAFISQMEAGIVGSPSKLKMIPTYMTLPTGEKEGDFLAIDMGGTNLRVMAVRLTKAHLQPQVLHVSKCPLSAADMSHDAHTLFARVAVEVNTFLSSLEAMEFYPPLRIREVGFTFSYPVTMISPNAGKIAALAKDLTASGLIGEDPFDLLFREFRMIDQKHQARSLSRLHPAALLNDTVTELIYAAYLKHRAGSDYPCRIGGIIGTGNNFALVLDTQRISKFKDTTYTPGQMILNMESGNFDAPSLPCNIYDVLVDANSSNPGAQRLEKTIAGNYLGRITGAVLQDLVEAGYLLRNDASTREALEDFNCVHMSKIETNYNAKPETALAELQSIGLPRANLQDLAIVKDVASLVSRRAAAIAATNVAAIVRFLDPAGTQKHTIAIDGSVFGKYPGYAAHMQAVLAQLFGRLAANIRLEYISDGSGIGAAIAAGT